MALFIIKLPFYESVRSLRPHLKYRRTKAVMFCSLIFTVTQVSASLAAFCLQSLFCELMCWHTYEFVSGSNGFQVQKIFMIDGRIRNFIWQPDFLPRITLSKKPKYLDAFLCSYYTFLTWLYDVSNYGPTRIDRCWRFMRDLSDNQTVLF
jgi:hypothetical protein